jgi:hypothetical protein
VPGLTVAAQQARKLGREIAPTWRLWTDAADVERS